MLNQWLKAVKSNSHRKKAISSAQSSIFGFHPLFFFYGKMHAAPHKCSQKYMHISFCKYIPCFRDNVQHSEFVKFSASITYTIRVLQCRINICHLFTISMDQVVDFYGCLESNDVFLKSADSVVFVELRMTL